MLTALKSRLGLLALSLLVALASSTITRADDALPQVGLVAAKSIDAVTAFVKQTGFDLPPDVNAAAIEKQFPFLGPGSLATDRPIGIVMCGGPGLSSEQMMAFVFPVKPGTATLDSLLKQGAVAMPDHADTVTMGGVGVRRTADYLIFSPNPAVATSVNPDALAAAVKRPDTLVKMLVDFKTIRTKMPEQYKAMLGTFESGALQNADPKTDKETSLMFVKPIVKTIDTIDNLDVALDNGENGLRLAITASPLKVAKGADAVNRPGFPSGVIARVDVNFATSESTANVRQQLEKAFITGATSDGKLTEEQKKKLADISDQLVALVCDPASTSLGVEMVGADPVIHVVQHWAKPIDAPKEWKRLMEQASAIAGGNGEDVKTETYAAGDLSVVRITLKSGQTFHIDLVQHESDVYMTVSPNEGHFVEKLAAAPAEGPMKGILSGWIDLGKSLDAAAKAPGSPLAGLPPEVQKQLADLLNNQKISIGTSAEGDAGTFELTITKGLVDNFPKLMAIFNPPAAKPAGDGKL